MEPTTSAQDSPTDHRREQHDDRDDQGAQDADGGQLDQGGADQVTQQRRTPPEHLSADETHRHGEDQQQHRGPDQRVEGSGFSAKSARPQVLRWGDEMAVSYTQVLTIKCCLLWMGVQIGDR